MRRFLDRPFRTAALLALMILAPAGAPAQAAPTATKETSVIQRAAKQMSCAGVPGYSAKDPLYKADCAFSGYVTGIRLERFASADAAAAAFKSLGGTFAGEDFHGYPAKSWLQSGGETGDRAMRGHHAWQAGRWLIISASREGDATTATKSMLSFSETLHAAAVAHGLFK